MYFSNVPKWLDHVYPRIEQLVPGSETTTRELFAPDVWLTLPPRKRRAIGRSIKRLAINRSVPLYPLGRDAANHQRYMKL